jgi:aryl-alcohol dehydrogenase-like predicted oxidoreductase
MEYRLLGGALKIPALTLGTATFGGGNDFFKKWGTTDVAEATRLISVALEHGLTMVDTSDSYSQGLSEEILGKAIAGRRNQLLVATKTGNVLGDGPDNMGTSGARIMRACEASLKRLGTDSIDLYQLHGFDALTPIDEMLGALDRLIKDGKIRHFGVSNFSGWHLMKMLALADRDGLHRPVSHQAYYSLVGREFEWELMPLALDQNIGTLVWSPLAGAKLSGKFGRDKPAPQGTRAATDASMTVPDEQVFKVTDALEIVSTQCGHSIPQVALAWLLARPSIASIVIGARNEAQLIDNLGATEFKLTEGQIRMLDQASDVRPIYPYWHQRAVFGRRNPPPV